MYQSICPVHVSLFLVVCRFCVGRRQTGGRGLLVAYKDYGFIFKMKMTEVSNPMQRKQKGLGMSLNSFDLKNNAMFLVTQREPPADDMVSTTRRNCVTVKRSV